MNPLAARCHSRLVLLLALALIAASAACSATSAQDEREPFPTLVPAESLIAPPTPPDDRAVLILTIEVQTNPDGSLRSAELSESTVINSYAPNVLGLSGPWTIELSSSGERGCYLDTTVCYGVEDPRWIEIENESGPIPFTDELAEISHWRVTVPLHRNGQDLNVTNITVLDQAGEEVIALVFDRESEEVLVATPVPVVTPTQAPVTQTSTLVPDEQTATTEEQTPTITPTASPNVIVRSLLIYDSIEQQIVPDLVMRWEVLDDALALMFHLEPSVFLSTGVPLTSEQVIARIAETVNFDVFAIDSISAVDDLTIFVDFAETGTHERFLYILSFIEFEVFSSTFD